LKLACILKEETGDEAIEIFGRADHRDFEGESGRTFGTGIVP
jgi:hypothetical protein